MSQDDELPSLAHAMLVICVALPMGFAIGGAGAWMLFDPVQTMLEQFGYPPTSSVLVWVGIGGEIGALICIPLVTVAMHAAKQFVIQHLTQRKADLAIEKAMRQPDHNSQRGSQHAASNSGMI